MTQPLVIFDLDGTLIHTAPDLMASLNHAIEPVGAEPVHYDDMSFLVGRGARVMIQRALEMRERPVSAEKFETLFDRFLEFYAKSMPGQSALYPGLDAAMSRLRDAGMPMAICTNKLEHLAVRLIESLGLKDNFVAILGGDSISVRKPDPEHILETIRRANASSAVMIGDSSNDIVAAREASVPSIAVTFGYTDIPVEQLRADYIIDHYNLLTPELVNRLVGATKSKNALSA